MKLTNSLSTLVVSSLLMLGMGAPAFAATDGNAQQVLSAHEEIATDLLINGKKVSLFPHLIAKDPYTGKMTSWVTVNALQSVLLNMGIRSEWVAGQLILMMPLGYMSPTVDVPVHPLHKGQFSMVINAETVEYGPVQVQSQAQEESFQVRIPIYYVMQAFRVLHLQSRWNGRVWRINGKLPNAAKDIQAIGHFDHSVAIHLQNDTANELGIPVAPIAPAAPVTVVLPLPSHAVATTRRFPMGGGSIPMEDFVQTGHATYIVNGNLEDIEQGYLSALKHAGFLDSGNGQMDNFKTGLHIDTMSFQPTHAVYNQQLQVNMDFMSLAGGKTLVEYNVTDVVLPARPQSSYLPTDMTQVKITIDHEGPTNDVIWQHLITNQAVIARLVHAVNALQEIVPLGITSGGGLATAGVMVTDDQVATMDFYTSHGKKIVVKDTQIMGRSTTVTVGNLPLQDPSSSVWKVIKAIAGQDYGN